MPDTAMRAPTAGSTNPPEAGDNSWRSRGACSFYGPALFFGRDHERAGDRIRREQHAKSICGTCPVLVPCLEFALNAGEGFGIWGGTTERERRSAYSQRERFA
ncbi:WhiB family transcriptional regulator [Rhodococcus sp. NPDC057529]|uniref:WhiB family transcriptional regulator n=1 Tax=Rhodococcus sp. NPDC057529 TaxID=3346158 RepID=UPI0036706F15